MKALTKSEWFAMEKPFGEPDENIYNNEYLIERYVYEDGSTVWFGIKINWKKEKDGNWTVLATNENAKPLEKYLPDIVYGEDRLYWKECEMPIYEKMYIELKTK